MPALLRRLTLPAVVLSYLIVPAIASASSTLNVVGTSDVSDSGLIQNVIEPAFNAAYPQYTFKYTGTASGTAIGNAEGGIGSPSVLIVHAASLENQFVAGGYSYNNQPGYAIFRNDFVLAGFSQDPAGVGANAAHNIVQAFVDIASKGYNGGGAPLATFVSRGGTPGTTVQEHAIWGLVFTKGLTPAGVYLCAVPANDGGGYTPTTSSAVGGVNGAACPNDLNGLPSGSDLPDWYAATGLTQGPNVLNANTCESSGYAANGCYVFTDRGTYDWLASGSDPAGSIANLATLTNNNSASAPGGADELVNYFHAYIINPAKPNEDVNLPAAKALISLLTSPVLQAQLKSYLSSFSSSSKGVTTFTPNPLGPPFVADASPTISQSGLAKRVARGRAITVRGTLINNEIGYPVLAGKTVVIDEIEAGLPVAVARGRTNSKGAYSITFRPQSTAAYQVSTGQIVQVENARLSPAFSDTLSPAATAPVRLRLTGRAPHYGVAIGRARVHGGRVSVTGSVKPSATRGTRVKLIAISTSTGRQRTIASRTITAGHRAFSIQGRLGKGGYELQLESARARQPAAYSGLKALTVK